MSDAPANLRLAGTMAAPAYHPIRGANAAAAELPSDEPPLLAHHDPRWVLAVRTQEALSDSMLAPAHRQRLLRLGKLMGLTDFEANLVIAVVQDQARRGGTLDAATPTLACIPVHHRRRASRRTGRIAAWVAAGLAAEALLLIALF